MKEITLIVKYSVKNGMVNDFLTALKNEGFPQIVQNENFYDFENDYGAYAVFRRLYKMKTAV